MNSAWDSEFYQCVKGIWLRESQPPELVWHYTKKAMLEAILKSNRIRATSIKDVNDETEFRYGKDLVDEILNEAQHHEASLFCDVRKKLDLFKAQRDVFVFCVSEERDCKSQWEDYGENGQGYALGFISSRLSALRKTKPHDLRLSRVEYEKSKQLSELREVVDCYRRYLRGATDADSVRVAEWLAHHLIRCVCRFKHKDWGSENEWRMVYAPEIDPPLEVKCTADGKRFVEMDLWVEPASHGAEPRKLPIREVMHGPACDPVSTMRILNDELTRNEYLTVDCLGSTIQP
ncbi:MAG TPA: DUF2971 domain-containing protein [Pyrinomonadaceae bacterium]|jgi:hypothetical protein|nr:DUF2971 domain-containing protein [Pyrinomonadaceae bacterium]